ncbi:VOC family protein [Nocardia farcinica]|uniref:VOC domain-containing protein n=1 Tax=Nocardia farcinica (strain IFM 10152) TaxID=247156 RepID=Q5YYC2_NOCFA|nr:VOC family protein [Nocardia farcinica]SLH88108.1 glyoxalase/bleomycin resistance protein/dioxygenase [Mycobacteroides abscessus subsp. abscessus]MBA4855901.1 VOC family protein [Nocardia farcinica]MBC9818522.1 VOC family protein [Nocardia farcinica]MBF6143228.1 VOC family protein [Nocardia farcinica]MBF6234104.1 VOC family protein [Nocardia farcinica]
MSARFDHTIIAAADRAESAAFYREILELRDAPSWGVFTNLRCADGVLLQFAEPPVDIQFQHYAFLVDDALFDRAYRRLRERGIEHWADPHRRQPGEINHGHGGRGVYFLDPAGHGLEILTRPYLPEVTVEEQ